MFLATGVLVRVVVGGVAVAGVIVGRLLVVVGVVSLMGKNK
jgi:hypothetical protein